jgi:DNA-binding NarL/FixJ family response regulator
MTEYAEYNALHATVVTCALHGHDLWTVPFLRGQVPSIVPAEAGTSSSPAIDKALTRRQTEIFHLIVRGKSNKEIARVLNLAPGTVKVHIAALFRKLGVKRRAAVAIAGAQFLADT